MKKKTVPYVQAPLTKGGHVKGTVVTLDDGATVAVGVQRNCPGGKGPDKLTFAYAFERDQPSGVRTRLAFALSPAAAAQAAMQTLNLIGKIKEGTLWDDKPKKNAPRRRSRGRA